MRKINDPGFGYSSKKNAKSILNKNGTSNIIHHNKKISFRDTYSYLIQISWIKFFGLVLIGYVIINAIFGTVYTLIGIEEITTLTGNKFKDFLNGFFFSAQTITTVGYGGISPHGLWANVVSTFEALVGLLSFSFITGLLYGRFSKPKASVRFSENIIHRNFKDGKALMFRLMNNRTSLMIDLEVSVTLSIAEPSENGELKKKFYQIELELDKIKYLPTTWTIVHEITSESPLFGLSENEIKSLQMEWYILMNYHEDSFSQKVFQIHSYTTTDLKFDVKFEPSTSFNDSGFTLLDHDKLSDLTALKD